MWTTLLQLVKLLATDVALLLRPMKRISPAVRLPKRHFSLFAFFAGILPSSWQDEIRKALMLV